MSTRRIEYVALDELTPAARNPKRHDLAKLEASFRHHSYVEPVVIDERTGRLVAGHGRVEALKAMRDAGKKPPEGVSDDWALPVVRGWASESDEQAQAYLVASNRLVEAGGWDESALAELLKEAEKAGALEATGYDEQELEDVLEAANLLAEPLIGATDPEVTPDERPTDIKRGDVFALGDHRIMCGDSTRAEDVAKLLDGAVPHLMVTDPPYGVEYDPEWRAKAKRSDGKTIGAKAIGKPIGDDTADWSEAWRLFPGDVAYVWSAPGQMQLDSLQSLLKAGMRLRQQVIWAKPQLIIGRGNYHYQHEPCWYVVRDGMTSHFVGDRKQTTLWQIDHNRSNETGHSTQKPIECMARPIRNNSLPGEAVYEPFSGSGTTIIACEQLKRRCLAMEIHPPYVQMAIDRWEAFTGRKAVKQGSEKADD